MNWETLMPDAETRTLLLNQPVNLFANPNCKQCWGKGWINITYRTEKKLQTCPCCNGKLIKAYDREVYKKKIGFVIIEKEKEISDENKNKE
jgi:excinuclease UvrABC ATPase subunit